MFAKIMDEIIHCTIFSENVHNFVKIYQNCFETFFQIQQVDFRSRQKPKLASLLHIAYSLAICNKLAYFGFNFDRKSTIGQWLWSQISYEFHHKVSVKELGHTLSKRIISPEKIALNKCSGTCNLINTHDLHMSIHAIFMQLAR